MKLKRKRFLRGNTHQYSKLGLRRKKKLKYRKGKGIDNKMRLNIKGHLRNIDAGFRSMKKTRDLVKGLKPIIIKNLNDLKKLGKSEIGIVAKVGNKKRKEIAEYAIKNNIKLYLDPKRTLERIEEKSKKIKEKQAKRKIRRTEKDKKSQKEAEKKAKKEAKEEARAEKKEEENKIAEEKLNESDKKPGIEEKQKEIQTNNYRRGK